MKKFAADYVQRGLMAAGFGPVTVAVVYLCLQQAGVMRTITINEACLGIFSSALLAFVVGGANVIYQVERLPILLAMVLHGSILYVSYITVYLLNGWLKWGSTPVLVFSICFLAGYLLIMAAILTLTKRRTARLNHLLRQKQQEQ